MQGSELFRGRLAPASLKHFERPDHLREVRLALPGRTRPGLIEAARTIGIGRVTPGGRLSSGAVLAPASLKLVISADQPSAVSPSLPGQYSPRPH